MSDKYGLEESANRIRAIVPSEVELTDDHRAILVAASKLIHMSALVESLQSQVQSLEQERERLRFELKVAKEWEAIDDTETNLANRRINSLKRGLTRAIDELGAWMRAADKGAISASNSADNDVIEYLNGILSGNLPSTCCDFHEDGGDLEAGCWEQERETTKDNDIEWPDDAKRCANCFERSVVNIDSAWHCLNCGVTEKSTLTICGIPVTVIDTGNDNEATFWQGGKCIGRIVLNPPTPTGGEESEGG